MNAIKKLGQGMLVAIGVLGLAGAASAGPKSITTCKTLDEAGSYLLTKNLTATGDCLVVTASGVSIDLGGWMLTGNGTGTGIKDLYAAATGTEIRNGSITNFEEGIELSGGKSIVEQVRVRNSADFGILVGSGSLVRNSVVSNSGSIGLVLNCPSTAVGNTVTNNADANIYTLDPGCLLSQNAAP